MFSQESRPLTSQHLFNLTNSPDPFSNDSPFLPFDLLPNYYFKPPKFDTIFSLQSEDERLNEGQSREKGSAQQSEEQRKEVLEPSEINKKNIVNFLLRNLKIRTSLINQVREYFEKNKMQEMKEIFDVLERKLSNIKKTKEELTKYIIRKSFKEIYTKMKVKHPQQFKNYENNQIVQSYFSMNLPQQNIQIPFSKKSQTKSMNSTFLYKIFRCEQYRNDYELFLQSFQHQCRQDNEKKIRGMNKIIEQGSGNYIKKLLEIKRYPWPEFTIIQLKTFSRELFVKYAPNGEQKSREWARKSGNVREETQVPKENNENLLETERQNVNELEEMNKESIWRNPFEMGLF